MIFHILAFVWSKENIGDTQNFMTPQPITQPYPPPQKNNRFRQITSVAVGPFKRRSELS